MKIFKKILGIVILAIIYGSVGWFTIDFIVTSVRCGESLLWSILKLPVVVIIASLIILIMNFAKYLIKGEHTK